MQSYIKIKAEYIAPNTIVYLNKILYAFGTVLSDDYKIKVTHLYPIEREELIRELKRLRLDIELVNE